MKFLGKFGKKKIFFFFFWGGGVGSGWLEGGRGAQGGCERKIEVFVKIQKKKIFFFWGGGGGGGGSGSGCGGGGVRVDVNEELKFLLKFPKKKFGGGGGGGVELWGGSGWM